MEGAYSESQVSREGSGGCAADDSSRSQSYDAYFAVGAWSHVERSEEIQKQG